MATTANAVLGSRELSNVRLGYADTTMGDRQGRLSVVILTIYIDKPN